MPKPPRGWHDSQWAALGKHTPEDRPVECDDCSWKGRESDVLQTLHEVRRLADRLDPGSITPVGTCPAIHTDSKDGDYTCGAFVYYSDVIVAYRRAPNVLERLAEEV